MSIGLNFRQTSGYVADGAGETYVLSSDSYPTTRGGWTFGWTTAITGDSNRSTLVDRRFAGMNFISNGVQDAGVFRVDLPATGQRDIRLALGDAASGTNSMGFSLWDDTTLIARQGTFSTFTGTDFIDATGVTRDPISDWIANNAAVTRTFVTTTFFLKIGSSVASSSTRLAHLFVADVAGGATTKPHHYMYQQAA